MLNISISNTANSDKTKFIFGLIVVLMVTTGMFLAIVQPGFILTDGGIFSAIAYKEFNGGTLYVDAWENKPPGIFYLLELFYLLIPDPVYGVFVMGLFSFLVSAFCLFRLISVFITSYTASLILSLIAVYFMLFANNIGDGLYTEIYGTMFLMISITLAETEIIKRQAIKFYLSGLSLGISVWFKEPFILLTLPLVLIYLIKLKSLRISGIYLSGILSSALLLLIILFLGGSLRGFFEVILYNFNYLGHEEVITPNKKLTDYYQNLFSPVFGLVLMFAICAYHCLRDATTRFQGLLWIIFYLSSMALVFISPYNFGHYYYPSFVLFFVCLGKLYSLRSTLKLPELKWGLIIISIYTCYRIDEVKRPSLNYNIKPFESNNIIDRLRQEKGKTLFVEYVVKGDYYIKTRLLYPTFVPVGLPVHFTENEAGLINRKRIWNDLNQKPPDYLLTTHTSTYFSWFLPEAGFYEKNYEKIDSFKPKDEDILYLWKHKTMKADKTESK